MGNSGTNSIVHTLYAVSTTCYPSPAFQWTDCAGFLSQYHVAAAVCFVLVHLLDAKHAELLDTHLFRLLQRQLLLHEPLEHRRADCPATDGVPEVDHSTTTASGRGHCYQPRESLNDRRREHQLHVPTPMNQQRLEHNFGGVMLWLVNLL